MKLAEKTIRVMLIEDHPTMLWGLQQLIDSEKPTMEVVGTATTCAEALAKIDPLTPDVILLDIDLGGQSTLDILPALLSNAVSRALIFTGVREQKTLDLAVLRGARGILSKDAPADQVLKAIEKTHQGELWLGRETLGRVFGQVMDPGATHRQDPETEKQSRLTTKERKVVQVVLEGSGALNKALAEQLFISEHTLRNHLTSIYEKLGVSNRLELYIYATKHFAGKSLS